MYARLCIGRRSLLKADCCRFEQEKGLFPRPSVFWGGMWAGEGGVG